MPDFRIDKLGDQLCRVYGTKVDEFYDPHYGPIEIYRLGWDSVRSVVTLIKEPA